jgi:glycosyltransferase involved in cell wall biosynthesis
MTETEQTKKPIVSVIMPAYNAEKYIGQAIESILGQSFKDFELIIVNDCSKDNTPKIIEDYARRDPRIVCKVNAVNLKLSKALNVGIGIARGKYIARMDADDISMPDRFEKQVSFLDTHPEVGIVGGTMILINDKNEKIGERKYQLDDKSIRNRIFKYSPFCHPAIMMRKDALEKAGLYDHTYNPAEDYDLYFRLGLVSKFANLNEPVFKYRVIPNSMTTGSVRKMELKTIEVRKNNYETYNATLTDKTYTILHYLSIYILPAKFKIWLFTRIREIFL